jgi:hypothetical protein
MEEKKELNAQLWADNFGGTYVKRTRTHPDDEPRAKVCEWVNETGKWRIGCNSGLLTNLVSPKGNDCPFCGGTIKQVEAGG